MVVSRTAHSQGSSRKMRYSRRARRRERCSRTRPNKEPAALCVCTWRPACSFSLAIKSALALHCVTFSLLGCASHTLCPRRASHNLIINPHVATAADSAAIYILLISASIWVAVKYAAHIRPDVCECYLRRLSRVISKLVIVVILVILI